MNVYQLKKLVDKEIKKGNGNKEIYTAIDPEGNGYTELLFGFTENVEQLGMGLKNDTDIVLG